MILYLFRWYPREAHMIDYGHEVVPWRSFRRRKASTMITFRLTFDPNTRELRTFSNVVWQKRHYNSSVSEVQQNEVDFGP